MVCFASSHRPATIAVGRFCGGGPNASAHRQGAPVFRYWNGPGWRGASRATGREAAEAPQASGGFSLGTQSALPVIAGGRDARIERPTPMQTRREGEAAKVLRMIRAPVADSVIGSILIAVILGGAMLLLLHR